LYIRIDTKEGVAQSLINFNPKCNVIIDELIFMVFNFIGISLCTETAHFQGVLCRCFSVSIPPHWVCRICFATTPDIVITVGILHV
jgi:hypothetical protein